MDEENKIVQEMQSTEDQMQLDTQSKDIQSKDTQSKDTQSKDTQFKDTQSKDTQSTDNQTKNDQSKNEPEKDNCEIKLNDENEKQCSNVIRKDLFDISNIVINEKIYDKIDDKINDENNNRIDIEITDKIDTEIKEKNVNNYETGNVRADLEQVNKKYNILCKFFQKGGCGKISTCPFLHQMPQLCQKLEKTQITFCRDYQNVGCRRPNCKFVHASNKQKEYFDSTGILPPSVSFSSKDCGTWRSVNMAHLKEQTMGNQKEDLSRKYSNKRVFGENKEDRGQVISSESNSNDKEMSDIEIIEIVDNKVCSKKDKGEKKSTDGQMSRKSDFKEGDKSVKTPKYSEHILKLKRVPRDARIDDIEYFFKGYRFKKNGIHQHRVDGVPIGTFFVEFDSNEDLMKAFDKDCKRLSPRDVKYIEIYRADVDELKEALEDNNIENVEISEFIKIKGIPINSQKRDIEDFFKGLKIAKDGIILPLDCKFERTRDCFVQFVSVEDGKKALLLDGEPLLSRYVRIQKSSKTQFKTQANLMLAKNKIMHYKAPSKNNENERKRKSINQVAFYCDKNPASTSQSLSSPRDSSVKSKNCSSSDEPSKRSKGIDSIFPYYFDEESLKNADQTSSISSRSDRKRSSSRDRSVPKRSKPSRPSPRASNKNRSTHRSTNNYFFKSFYNEPVKNTNHSSIPSSSSLERRIVKVRDIPNNSKKEDISRFFEQADLYPKNIKIYVDRGRRYSEAEVEFRSMEDAKKSFLLSGARLRSEDGYVKHVEVVINPDLSRLNIVNPLSKSITTKFTNNRSNNNLNEQSFPFEYELSPNKSLKTNTKKKYHHFSSVDNMEPNNSSINLFEESEDALNNFLTSKILIDKSVLKSKSNEEINSRTDDEIICE